MIRRLPGPLGVYDLLWRHEPGDAGVRVELRDLDAAAAFVRSLLHRSSAGPMLRRFLEQDAPSQLPRDDREVIALLALRISSGAVRVRRHALPVLHTWSEAGESKPPPAPTVARSEPTTWIEIELVDMAGEPIRGERYWIELPDGTVREGRLNDKGRAYFDGLDAGECEIRWPDLDTEAVALPGQEGAAVPRRRTSPPPRTWIALELRDMAGKPVAHERFSIKLPDGTLHEGQLDDAGQAWFGDLNPGSCEIRWPDLDHDAIG